MDAKLIDQRSGNIIWQENNMKEREAFNVDSEPLVTRYNQQQALNEMAKRLAKRIYLKTMERF